MKWFKLWATAPTDAELQALDPSMRWAWIGAACYTAIHGTKGVLTLPVNGLAGLALFMAVESSTVTEALRKLPHLTVKIVTRNVTVTWDNWQRFQQDTSAAERMRRYRQRRGEEKIPPTPHEQQRPAFVKTEREPAFVSQTDAVPPWEQVRGKR